MNERIRELAIQAEEYAFGEIDKIQGPAEMFVSKRTFDKSFREKFAELIVQECVELCREEGKKLEEQSIHSNSYQSYFLASLIKHHFGVE